MAHRARTANAARLARHERLRKKVFGTPRRPRLAVYRSLNHIYAQVIDDTRSHTVVQASSLDPEVREVAKGKRKRQVAEVVGGLVARRASEAGVTSVVFDRGGFRYHGRVEALAAAARKGGLVF